MMMVWAGDSSRGEGGWGRVAEEVGVVTPYLTPVPLFLPLSFSISPTPTPTFTRLLRVEKQRNETRKTQGHAMEREERN